MPFIAVCYHSGIGSSTVHSPIELAVHFIDFSALPSTSNRCGRRSRLDLQLQISLASFPKRTRKQSSSLSISLKSFCCLLFLVSIGVHRSSVGLPAHLLIGHRQLSKVHPSSTIFIILRSSSPIIVPGHSPRSYSLIAISSSSLMISLMALGFTFTVPHRLASLATLTIPSHLSRRIAALLASV